MSGEAIALDTNQAIAVLNGLGDSAAWVSTFSPVFAPVPIMGELRFGALNSRDSEKNLNRVNEFINRSQILGVTLETTT